MRIPYVKWAPNRSLSMKSYHCWFFSGSIAIGIFVWLPIGYLLGKNLINNSQAAKEQTDIIIDLCNDPSTAIDCNDHGNCTMDGEIAICQCETGFMSDDCSIINCDHLK